LGKCSDAGAHAWTTSLTYWTRKRNSRFVERLEEQMRLLFNIPCIQPVQQEITTHIMRIHRLIETIGGHFVAENLVYTIHFQQLKLSITIILLHLDALKRINTIIIDLDRDI
jgi:adenylosuccinate lyase